MFVHFEMIHKNYLNFDHLGGSGSDGEDPPVPKRSVDAPTIWNEENFIFQLMELRSNASGKDIPKEVYTEYIVWTKGYINPGDGGDGGVGGIGGNAGKVYAIGLNGRPHFQIFNSEGNTNGRIIHVSKS